MLPPDKWWIGRGYDAPKRTIKVNGETFRFNKRYLAEFQADRRANTFKRMGEYCTDMRYYTHIVKDHEFGLYDVYRRKIPVGDMIVKNGAMHLKAAV